MSTSTAPAPSAAIPDRISVAGTVVEIFLILAVAILLNFFPQSVGYVMSADDPGTFTPVLAPSFAAFMPWLNTLWFWSLCLCLAHLTLRRWTAVTRGIDLVLDLCGAAIVGVMFFASPFRDLPVVTTAIRSGARGSVLRLPARSASAARLAGADAAEDGWDTAGACQHRVLNAYAGQHAKSFGVLWTSKLFGLCSPVCRGKKLTG